MMHAYLRSLRSVALFGATEKVSFKGLPGNEDGHSNETRTAAPWVKRHKGLFQTARAASQES